ncbi:hypothetical protein [Shinella zoogloeoides]|uniref:hypothetical protein n=1 Tax=Shinella zoogloeoides TaxID=352475 RepID=UPI0039A74659
MASVTSPEHAKNRRLEAKCRLCRPPSNAASSVQYVLLPIERAAISLAELGERSAVETLRHLVNQAWATVPFGH